MKSLTLLVLFVSLSSLQLFAQESCRLVMADKIIVMGKLSAHEFVHESTCPITVTAKVAEILSNTFGVVPAALLSERAAAESDFQGKVSISPSKISVASIQDIFLEKMSEKTEVAFSEIQVIGKKINSISLKMGDSLDVEFSSDALGVQNIQMKITNTLTGSTKTYWFTAKLVAKLTALVPVRNIPVGTAVQAEWFKKKVIYSERPQDYITSFDGLKFSKTTRSIVKGQLIFVRDLMGETLVQVGRMADVSLKADGFLLQEKANPISNGKLGEMVTLTNIKNGRKIVGKVVDLNKVEVSL